MSEMTPMRSPDDGWRNDGKLQLLLISMRWCFLGHGGGATVRFGCVALPNWGIACAETQAAFHAVPKTETVAA